MSTWLLVIGVLLASISINLIFIMETGYLQSILGGLLLGATFLGGQIYGESLIRSSNEESQEGSETPTG